MSLAREIMRWPDGCIRDEYPLLFGLRLGDFWLALALIVGVIALPALFAL